MPNYNSASVQNVCASLADSSLTPLLMIDCSHANSSKDYTRQKEVARDIAAQITAGDMRIMGAMIESHLSEGRQEQAPGSELAYGKSITDACLGWQDSVELLETLAASVRARRKLS